MANLDDLNKRPDLVWMKIDPENTGIPLYTATIAGASFPEEIFYFIYPYGEKPKAPDFRINLVYKIEIRAFRVLTLHSFPRHYDSIAEAKKRVTQHFNTHVSEFIG